MKLWHRKTARAYIFDQEKKLFLLVKSSLPPFGVHLPGGGINRGESPEDAVRRELKEELNILPENILSVSYMCNRKNFLLMIPHSEEIFLVFVKDLRLRLSWEISKVVWMTYEQVRNNTNASIIDRTL